MARQWILAGWLTLVLAVALLSLVPAAAPPGDYGIDKILHLFAFLALAAMPAVVLAETRPILLAALFLIIVGGGIEVAQSFIPGRVAAGLDLAMDVVGVVLGVALGRVASRYLGRILPSLRPVRPLI